METPANVSAMETEEEQVNLCEDDIQPVEKVTDLNDPYFYTNQEGFFTSEIYKIELHNLPKYFGLGVSVF
jgi:hypothetical protein